MKGQPSVWRRTQRLAVRQDEIDARCYVRMVAEREGIDSEELWAETLAFKRECAQLGLRTEEERLAQLARTEGIPLDELRAALAEVRTERP